MTRNPVVAFENADLRLPSQNSLNLAIIRHVNRLVRFARLIFVRDRNIAAEFFPEQIRRLDERKRVRRAAADVKHLTEKAVEIFHLQLDEAANIFDKENVAHLLAFPADIFERQSEMKCHGPPRAPTLGWSC